MIKTNQIGVYFREIKTNSKADKVYYITYKDLDFNKKIWIKIGKYSEGIREAYCNAKRNEILTKQRIGEEPPIIAQRKKREILSIQTLANEYFSQRKDGESKRVDSVYYEKHILPFLKSYDLELLGKNDIVKFTNYLKDEKIK